jgi:hypothetical protein
MWFFNHVETEYDRHCEQAMESKVNSNKQPFVEIQEGESQGDGRENAMQRRERWFALGGSKGFCVKTLNKFGQWAAQ